MISVVVPVYNVEAYLPECLDSILNQTYRDIEIILVDDGSTDRCGEICDEYARRDARIRVFHTNNRGLAVARNLGLEHVRGSYVSFIDSDDWIEPDSMEKLLNAVVQYNADIAVGKVCREYIGHSDKFQKEEGGIRIDRGEAILSAYINGQYKTYVWNKLYHANCFEDIQFPVGCNYEDVSTTWRLMKKLSCNGGVVVVLAETLFHYRIRKSSIAHTKSLKNIVDYWRAHHDKFERLPDYRKKLLPSCIIAIGRMWAHYYSFSQDEKLQASEPMTKMQSFINEHFHSVIRGDYNYMIKAICILCRFRSPLVMWLCHWGNRLRRAIMKIEGKMYP